MARYIPKAVKETRGPEQSCNAHLSPGPGQGERFCIFSQFQTSIGMGIQPLGTSSGSILKLLLFPSFCTSSRKIPFASFYMIFCFISYMNIKPQGKGRQSLGTVFYGFSGFWGEDVWRVWTTDGQWILACTISSPMSLQLRWANKGTPYIISRFSQIH